MRQANRKRTEYPALRWLLAVAAFAFIAAADWFADGLGPRLLLGSATLQLHSEPPAARVLLNGEFVGETPLRETVRPGEVVVRFEHRFHDAAAQRIVLARDEERRVDANFAPAEGVLEITSNPRGATLLLDGEPLEEAAPAVLDLPSGAYAVTATIPARQTKTETVEVLPRGHTRLAFELERQAVGQLFVSLHPADATLEIVDVAEPYQPGMMLPFGAYQMRASRRGYASEQFTLWVRYGENRHAVRLERLAGRLRLNVQPATAMVEVSFQQGSERRTHRLEHGDQLRIPTGSFEVRAEALGHRSYRRRLTMPPQGLTHAVSMKKHDVTAGERFRDRLRSGGEGPLLVVVPAGRFRMGSRTGASDERPVRTVTVLEPFALGVFELTECEFARQPAPAAEPSATPCAENLPATSMTWQAAVAHLAWLSEQTGHRYRLPSEAEWEYAARAGQTGRYHHGNAPARLCAFANIADRTLAGRFTSRGVAPCSDGEAGTAPVGRLRPNAFGLHDTLGNVEEWVADCWNGSHADAPETARARTDGHCGSHVVRGGGWDSTPEEATLSYRSFSSVKNSARGFRVLREL